MDIKKIIQELNAEFLKSKSARTDTLAQVLPPEKQLRDLQATVTDLLGLWEFYHAVEFSNKRDYSR